MYGGGKLTTITNGQMIDLIPDRIKEARIYRGWSQKELADKIGVTKQSISCYEKGSSTPTSEVLSKISDALVFPLKFFYKKKPKLSFGGEIYFRSSAIPAKKKEMLAQRLDSLWEIVDFAENYIRLPDLEILNVPYKKEYSKEDIIAIAYDLRKLWGLGDGPIENLTYIMQKKGCIIARLNLDSEKTDGFSKKVENGRPLTFLNSVKNAAVRERFTLAHELGHIILHQNLKPGEDIKKREKESNFFAGEFLFPSSAVEDEIAYVALDSLKPIKLKWGISIGVIIRRCLDVGLITDTYYTALQKQISKRKWRTLEPFDDIIKPEKPMLFKEAFDLIDEHGMLEKSDIHDLIAFDDLELTTLCCLPYNYFEPQIIDVRPRLTIVK